jgi:hypothetical protein
VNTFPNHSVSVTFLNGARQQDLSARGMYHSRTGLYQNVSIVGLFSYRSSPSALASSLLPCIRQMPLITLKMLARRMAELLRAYDNAMKKNDPRAGTISEELDQLRVIYDELERVVNLTTATPKADLAGGKFDAVGLAGVLGLIRTCARQIAKISRDDPARNELVNEFTCLVMVAEKIANPTLKSSRQAPI